MEPGPREGPGDGGPETPEGGGPKESICREGLHSETQKIDQRMVQGLAAQKRQKEELHVWSPGQEKVQGLATQKRQKETG